MLVGLVSVYIGVRELHSRPVVICCLSTNKITLCGDYASLFIALVNYSGYDLITFTSSPVMVEEKDCLKCFDEVPCCIVVFCW